MPKLREMTMRCPKCETINPGDSKFCKECATPLPPDPKAQVSFTRTLEAGPLELSRGMLSHLKRQGGGSLPPRERSRL